MPSPRIELGTPCSITARYLPLGYAATTLIVSIYLCELNGRSVKDLARLSLEQPVFVSVHENAEHTTPDTLTQSYIVTDLHHKVSYRTIPYRNVRAIPEPYFLSVLWNRNYSFRIRIRIRRFRKFRIQIQIRIRIQFGICPNLSVKRQSQNLN